MKINKSQIILTDKFNALRFFLNRGRGHRLRYLLNRVRWSWYPRMGYVSRFPDHLDVEITNNCNMNCAMCFRNIMFKKGIKPGFMDFNLFKKIIDEAARRRAFSIRLSWRGEPLVHPRLIDMIKYAKKKGIKEVSFLTNGLALKGKLAEDLVKSGVDWITVSFDGLGKTYEKIRYPAKFPEALKRIKDFQKIKKRLGSKKPVLKVQSIWPAIKDNPKKFYDTFKDIADSVATNPFKDYGAEKIEHDPDFMCPHLWHRFVITWDGKVPMCLYFTENCIVGNVNTQSISKIWRGKEFNRLRKIHRQKKRLKLYCCRNCLEGAMKKKVTVTIGKRKTTQYAFSKNYENTKNKRMTDVLKTGEKKIKQSIKTKKPGKAVKRKK